MPDTPEITMQMLRAGMDAYEAFDPEVEEPQALVAGVYWAMEAAKPPSPAQSE